MVGGRPMPDAHRAEGRRVAGVGRLRGIMEAMPVPGSEATRLEYAARINRVMDHVQAHLDEPLDLGKLAHIACFSPFHFHRIFQAWTGETLQDFVHRLRLERAAQRLVFDRKASITDIALDCGFSGSSPFARAFKRAYGVTASAWRDRKNGQEGTAPLPEPWRTRPVGAFPENPMPRFPLDVQVRVLPPLPLAYLRHIGPFMGDVALFRRLFTQLIGWADGQGLMTPETQVLSLFHDNPNLTPKAMHRLEVALSVPPSTKGEGPVGIQTLEGGRYATATARVTAQEIPAAWNTLVGDWLPGSGFQPDHRPALEFYRNHPDQDPEGKYLLEIALPVRKL